MTDGANKLQGRLSGGTKVELKKEVIEDFNRIAGLDETEWDHNKHYFDTEESIHTFRFTERTTAWQVKPTKMLNGLKLK